MSYQFVDPDNRWIRTPLGHIVPVEVGNVDYDAIVASGTAIAPFAPRPTSADDVRGEARRRMRVLTSARDDAHLEMIIANGSRDAIRLLRIKSDRTWTTEEAARAAYLEAVDAAIEAIRAASNVMEPAPPADYTDDSHWPAS